MTFRDDRTCGARVALGRGSPLGGLKTSALPSKSHFWPTGGCRKWPPRLDESSNCVQNLHFYGVSSFVATKTEKRDTKLDTL